MRLHAKRAFFVLALCVTACESPSLLEDGLDPPRVPPVQGFPNAPGWRIVTDLSFSQAPVGLTNDHRDPDNGSGLIDWINRGRGSVRDDPAAPASPTGKVLDVLFPRGLWGGEGDQEPVKITTHPDHWLQPGAPLSWPDSMNHGSLYIGIYFRLSLGFSLVGSNGQTNFGGQKILYLLSDGNETRHPDVYPVYLMFPILVPRGGDPDKVQPCLAGQVELAGQTQDARTSQIWCAESSDDNNVNDGNWHLVEGVLTGNRPGVADGQLHIWLDGRLVAQATNVGYFGAGHERLFDAVKIAPVYGGGYAKVANDQHLYVSRLLVQSN